MYVLMKCVCKAKSYTAIHKHKLNRFILDTTGLSFLLITNKTKHNEIDKIL